MASILVVIVIAALSMFSNSLKDIVANNGLTKNMLSSRTTIDEKVHNQRYDLTQENVSIAGAQGIIAKFDAQNPEDWINSVFANIFILF